MRRWLIKHALIFPMLFAALAFFFASPVQNHVALHAQEMGYSEDTSGSPASEGLQATDGRGGTMKCADMPEAKGGVLLGRIVPCLIRTISNTTQSFSATIIQALMPLFYSFLVFVVTMFGVKVLQGGRDLHQQGILLLLKITLVLMILDQIPYTFVPAAYGIMQESQSIVASAIGPGSSSMHCQVSNFGDGATQLIWAQMDCVLGKLYGFATGKSTNADGAGGGGGRNMFLAASVLGMAGGFFFSGTFGITIFLACIGVLISVFMMVMRTAIAFVNGYLVVCVLLIIAPLLLPLVFLKVTASYFEKWWKAILAAMLLPVLVTAYAMFALLLYDKMLFAPDALVNKLFDYSLVKDAQVPPQNMCGRATTGNLDFTKASSLLGDLKRKMKDPMTHDTTQPQLSGTNNPCSALTRHVISMDEIAGKLKSSGNSSAGAMDFIKHVFNDCVKLVILAVVITRGMQTVMGLLPLMTGSQAVSSLMNASSPQEVALQKRFQHMKDSAMHSMSYDENGNKTSYSGTGFLRQLGPSVGAALKSGLGE